MIGILFIHYCPPLCAKVCNPNVLKVITLNIPHSTPGPLGCFAALCLCEVNPMLAPWSDHQTVKYLDLWLRSVVTTLLLDKVLSAMFKHLI